MGVSYVMIPTLDCYHSHNKLSQLIMLVVSPVEEPWRGSERDQEVGTGCNTAARGHCPLAFITANYYYTTCKLNSACTFLNAQFAITKRTMFLNQSKKLKNMSGQIVLRM